MVALGESLKVLLDRNLGSCVPRLTDVLISDRISICTLGRRELGRLSDLINRIRTNIRGGDDRFICPTDILILAHSMADRECRGLLTFDNNLIGSRSIRVVVDEHLRDRKSFIISDYVSV